MSGTAWLNTRLRIRRHFQYSLSVTALRDHNIIGLGLRLIPGSGEGVHGPVAAAGRNGEWLKPR